MRSAIAKSLSSPALAVNLHPTPVDRISPNQESLLALGRISLAFATFGSEGLFQETVRYLAQELAVEFAMVGALNVNGDRISVRAAIHHGQLMPLPLEYDVSGTPCSETVKGHACYIDTCVHEKYPEDLLLSEMGVECYLGIPMHNASGELVGLIAVLHSMTLPDPQRAADLLGLLALRVSAEVERQRTVTLLQQSEARYRKLFQTAPNCIKEMQPDGTITSMNDAGLSMLGLKNATDVLGQPFIDFVAESDRAQASHLMQRATEGHAVEFEFKTTKTNKPLVLSTNVVPLNDESGKPGGLLAVTRDVTERRRMEAELDTYRQHLEDLVADRTKQLTDAQKHSEEASQAKSTFLAVMSHEIRTPLNAIIGLAHLFSGDPLTDRQVDWLNKIDTSAGHLLAIINNILDLSKIEAGKLALHRTAFNLGELLEQVIAQHQYQAESKGLKFKLDYAGVPLELKGDPLRLSQALINYLSNAVKFSRDGEIEVRAKLLDDGPKKVELRFEVTDCGVGIKSSRLDHLFEAFEQADWTTTREFGGTGLGLAITRQFAKLMGGEVGVSSVPGKGSTFWFTVTLNKALRVSKPAKSTAVSSVVADAKAFHRILVAEDHPINREVMVAMLSTKGFQVDIAVDGREAVTKAAEGQYDLILMDMRMPDLDGLQATREIRSNPALRRLPILAITANVFAEDRIACLDAGMNDFVPKPVRATELFATVENWLKQSASGELEQN